MYDIKDVISKMKQIANIDSNANLARLLNVSYNTLNTWIKRDKLPQEVILSFCREYNCSIDYLLLEKNSQASLFSNSNENSKSTPKNSLYNFKYYGKIKENQISEFINLTVNKSYLHSNGYYLINKNNIYKICICNFDLFNNIVYLKDINMDLEHKITYEEFKSINKGLIIKFD